MDIVDSAILNRIQDGFPLAVRPYSVLGRVTGVPEAEAWRRVQDLRKNGIIRRIGGIFDSRCLGYVSTLCAARVPADKVRILAERMQDIQEITHNYLRRHRFNMWFTVIAASPERLDQIIAQIRKELGSNEVFSLPAKRVFKINVRFQMEADNAGAADNGRGEGTARLKAGASAKKIAATGTAVALLTEEDKALIRLLQEDLPGTLTPFADLAAQLHTDAQTLIARTRRLLESGILRRLGAVLVHYKAGYTANAMGVWVVPETLVQNVGEKMAEFKEVSHCYERVALPDWPYNLYTMVHEKSPQECEQVMQRISQAINIAQYSLLFSQAELKKSSMRYFLEDASQEHVI